jgi:two-component system LytT family response regulator
MRIAFADDEPLARRRLRARFERDPELAIVAECKNGYEISDVLARTQLDLLFLDILMPGIDGLSIIAQIPDHRRPSVVLVTAHDRYAVRAFDVHVVDYLLKPYDDDRFAVALARAKAAVPARAPERLAVRGRRGTTLLPIDSIDWVESADNYVEVHAGGDTHLVRITLAELEQRLPARDFARVHRRAIVNLRRVRAIHAAALMLDGDVAVPVGRRYRGAIEQRLGLAR